MSSTTSSTMSAGARIAPFPTRQMTILALCRICEPIAFMSIFPYIYFMVQDFGVAESATEISVYAGMVTSAFTFAEFSSGVAWGRLSDKVGRKPVLLFGLAGTALSMIIFGFAPSLPVALLARALGGLLNGNIGVLQTTVAEMVTVKEHQPRAYTIMPFVWCLGSILGPTLGGALAKPHESYPTFFRDGTIWTRFPYLLPNLICTFIVLCGVVIGILFLEETHAEKKYRRDPGLELGKWIISKVCGGAVEPQPTYREKCIGLDEVYSLMGENEPPPGYRTTESSPHRSPTSASAREQSLDLMAPAVTLRTRPAATKAFTRPVVLNIIGYGILAYHTMTFDAMLPTHLSANPDEHRENWLLPFKFVSGYHMDTKQIGVMLSIQGLYSMFATIFLFPIIVRRLGALNLFRLLSITYPLLYLTTPYLALLPGPLRMGGIYALVIWKCTFSTLAYPSNAILLTNSAPSLLLLGTINGVAASTASLSRAFGPTVSGFLFSAGLRLGYSGLAWWSSAIIALVGAVISLSMSDQGGRMELGVDQKFEEYRDEEQGPDEPLMNDILSDSTPATGDESSTDASTTMNK